MCVQLPLKHMSLYVAAISAAASGSRFLTSSASACSLLFLHHPCQPSLLNVTLLSDWSLPTLPCPIIRLFQLVATCLSTFPFQTLHQRVSINGFVNLCHQPFLFDCISFCPPCINSSVTASFPVGIVVVRMFGTVAVHVHACCLWATYPSLLIFLFPPLLWVPLVYQFGSESHLLESMAVPSFLVLKFFLRVAFHPCNTTIICQHRLSSLFLL